MPNLLSVTKEGAASDPKSLSLGKNPKASWNKLHWVTEESQVLHRDAFLPIFVKQFIRTGRMLAAGKSSYCLGIPVGFSDSTRGFLRQNFSSKYG